MQSLYKFYGILHHGFTHVVEHSTPNLSQEKIANLAGQMIIAHQKERTIKPGINRLILEPFFRSCFRVFLSILFKWFLWKFVNRIFQVNELPFETSVTASLISRTLMALFIVPFLMEKLMIEDLIAMIISLDPAEFIFLWITGETTFLSKKTKKILVKVTFPSFVLIHLFFRDHLINYLGTFLVNKLAELLYQACFLKAGAVFHKEYVKWMELPKVKLHLKNINIMEDD
jgi:hypothetical protein